MKKRTKKLFIIVLCAAAATPAAAQVTVNPGALDQLGGTPSPQAAPAHPIPPHHPPPPHRAAETKPPAHPSPPPHPAPAKPKPPVVPPAPPPEAVVKPIEPPPPTHPTAPPPPAAVIADAPGEASTTPQGIRVTFGPDRSDLNPATEQALQAFAHATPTAIFNVTSFAPGSPTDPSTPRRLSLSRALSVRSVLIAQGVPSTRIYAHAMGPNFIDGPPDRVDVTATVPPPPAPPAGPAPPGK